MRFDLGHQGDQLGPVEFPGEGPGSAVGQLLIQGQSQPQRLQVGEVVGCQSSRRGAAPIEHEKGLRLGYATSSPCSSRDRYVLGAVSPSVSLVRASLRTLECRSSR